MFHDKINKDILFKITDFLKDEDSMNLFFVNKNNYNYFIKYPTSYKIKKEMSIETYYNLELKHQLLNIKNYYPGECKLPIGVKSIKYDNQSEYKNIENLPDTVERITIGSGFELLDKFPRNIKDIDTSRNEYCIIKNLPENLLSLIISGPIPEKLPTTLKVLDFSESDYNESIDKILESLQNLEVLCLAKNYNQPINNIPKTLKKLVLGYSYNNSLDILENIDNLEILELGLKFNQTLNNLPKKLKKLKFGHKFNQSIDNFPLSIEELEVNNNFNMSVKHLVNLKIFRAGDLTTKFKQPFTDFSNTLEVLELGDDFNEDIKEYPPNLKILKLGKYHKFSINNYNKPLNNLPKNLRELYIYSYTFDQYLDNLPESLEILDVRSWIFNRPLDNLPKNLKTLIVIENFNQPTDKFPSSLENFKFGIYFNQDIRHLKLKTLRYDFERHYFDVDEIYPGTKVIDDYDIDNDPNIRN
jgi:hypothetical protein